jgi:uncharacterized protein YjbI with pentapeptide repeats
MANKEHLDILKQGVDAWNIWRSENSEVRPDLSRAFLIGADLAKADFHQTNFQIAELMNADLSQADLIGADLYNANLSEAKLCGAKLLLVNVGKVDSITMKHTLREIQKITISIRGTSKVNLSGTDLQWINLSEAKLDGANLSEANLLKATLNKTNLENANLTGCLIYGISAWNVQLKNATQSNLIISDIDEPTITVDNLAVAQFIYLLLNNENIRSVIDTIVYKVVLILGRFTLERKAVLDAIKNELRRRNYLPVLFDFEKPATRDITETVSTLAHLAGFVIADITEPKSIPQELQAIIPHLPSVPIQPLLQVSDREYGMFEHFVRYPWVHQVYRYHDVEELLHSFQEHIIDPAEMKVRKLTMEKAKRLERP